MRSGSSNVVVRWHDIRRSPDASVKFTSPLYRYLESLGRAPSLLLHQAPWRRLARSCLSQLDMFGFSALASAACLKAMPPSGRCHAGILTILLTLRAVLSSCMHSLLRNGDEPFHHVGRTVAS
jgi:hypothetical protein